MRAWIKLRTEGPVTSWAGAVVGLGLLAGCASELQQEPIYYASPGQPVAARTPELASRPVTGLETAALAAAGPASHPISPDAGASGAVAAGLSETVAAAPSAAAPASPAARAAPVMTGAELAMTGLAAPEAEPAAEEDPGEGGLFSLGSLGRGGLFSLQGDGRSDPTAHFAAAPVPPRALPAASTETPAPTAPLPNPVVPPLAALQAEQSTDSDLIPAERYRPRDHQPAAPVYAPPVQARAPARAPTPARAPALDPGLATLAMATPPMSGEQNFFIEVGSFLRQENAAEVAQRLAALGLPVSKQAVRVGERIFLRISAGPFPFRTEAEWAQALLRDQEGIDGAIIM